MAKKKVERRMLSYYADDKDIDKLSPRAENLFTRLLPLLDDFGDHRADIMCLKVRCFPTKTKWTNQMVKAYRDELVSAGIAVLYGEDGYECPEGAYIHYVKFTKHQKLNKEKCQFEVPIYLGRKGGTQAGTCIPPAAPKLVLESEGGHVPQVPVDATKTRLREEEEEEKKKRTSSASSSNPSGTPSPNPCSTSGSTSGSEPFNVITFKAPITSIPNPKKEDDVPTDYDAETVARAIHWAFNDEKSGSFWKPKIGTLTGLRKSIKSMVAQMGDYRIPRPRIMPKHDPLCPVCKGLGDDPDRPYRLCACTRYVDQHGVEYDYYAYKQYRDVVMPKGQKFTEKFPTREAWLERWNKLLKAYEQNPPTR